jgi:two-component system chemotaxis sensor kinase CheA
LDQKYQELFIEESKELLQSLNQALLTLEASGEDAEVLNEAFRLMHTIKGAAKVLGIESIGELAHITEDILDKIKVKKLLLNQNIIDMLFEATDYVARMVGELSDNGEISTDCSDFIKQLQKIINSDETTMTQVKGKAILEININKKLEAAFKKAKSEGLNIFLVSFGLNEKCKLKEGRIYQVFRELKSIGKILTSAPKKDEVSEDTTKTLILLATSSNSEDVKAKAGGVSNVEEILARNINDVSDLEQNKRDEEKYARNNAQLTTSDTVRVKSRYLDNLMNLVGELMISEIRVKQIAEDINHKELKQFLKNNDRLIGELQDKILRMRMVPIDHIFKRFPRMVRDISKEMKKEIEFQMVGNDIEIDRSLLDNVSDAVMHLLRNSIDHGIELAQERKSSNKKRSGTLLLKTSREQNNIVIEVIDDGSGIEIEKIVSTAISKGLITQEKANSLDEKEKLELIFLPGLTTTEEVSDVSGRGVGLDVVNEKVKHLGGTVRLETYPNMGTKVMIKLPPSMAIIRAMLLEVNDQKYAVPLEDIIETIKVNEQEVHNIMSTGVFRLRDEVLPISNLLVELGGNGFDNDNGHSQMPVVIVEKNGIRAGLVVNRLIGQQEIVIKNLGKHIRNAGYFSGATILGDGRVAMILDVEAFL